MAKIEKMEDLKVWQVAKTLAVSVYQFTKSLLHEDAGMQDQMRRAAVSVATNIAEGYGRGGNKEFIQFLAIAKGSLYELKTQLIISNEIGYISDANKSKLILNMELEASLIGGLSNYLKNSDFKGSKYKTNIVSDATSRYEPQTSNLELQTSNLELRTSNSELRTSNSEPQTMNEPFDLSDFNQDITV